MDGVRILQQNVWMSDILGYTEDIPAWSVLCLIMVESVKDVYSAMKKFSGQKSLPIIMYFCRKVYPSTLLSISLCNMDQGSVELKLKKDYAILPSHHTLIYRIKPKDDEKDCLIFRGIIT